MAEFLRKTGFVASGSKPGYGQHHILHADKSDLSDRLHRLRRMHWKCIEVCVNISVQ